MVQQVNGPFDHIDDAKASMSHLKIWFTAGMGFFTDAYDLFIIGAVLDVFSRVSIPGFLLSQKLLGMPISGFIGASAIFTAIVGQLVFGRLADLIGRKTVYGVEATILAVGALLSAFSPNVFWLILFRLIEGVGIGGDYPVSATIMSEYSNVKDRGKFISLVFANQGIGSVAAVAVGVLSLVVLPPSIAWRVMLGVGALPALSVLYLRRRVPETPRYSLLAKGDTEEANRAAKYVGAAITTTRVRARKTTVLEFLRNYGGMLAVTASTWFILDMALYGTGVFSGPIVSSIIPINTSLSTTAQLRQLVLDAGLPFFVGFFGYFTAVALMDKLGRRLIQIQGFALMAALYLVVASLMVVHGTKVTGFLVPTTLAVVLYSLTFFFIDFGPNTTTFVTPVELYPVNYRASGHGISAATGKIGAAITTFLFPTLLITVGLKDIMLMLAVLSLLGAGVSMFLRESNQLVLEEASREVVEAA